MLFLATWLFFQHLSLERMFGSPLRLYFFTSVILIAESCLDLLDSVTNFKVVNKYFYIYLHTILFLCSKLF